MMMLLRQSEVRSACDSDCDYDEAAHNGKDNPGRKALPRERHRERSKGGKILLDFVTAVGVTRYITLLYTLASDGRKQ
jgi:hypothetical protein